MAEWTNAAALKAAGRKARGFESLPFRWCIAAMTENGVPLDNIARHVGHRSTTTTAGYVRSHKERDRATAKRAASLLDAPAV